MELLTALKDDTTSTAFSLGRVGDNLHGPVTEQCSPVTAFCVTLADEAMECNADKDSDVSGSSGHVTDTIHSPGG